MNSNLLILIIVVYLVWVVALVYLSRDRDVGGPKILLISLFLTPIVGLLFFLGSSERKMNIYHVAQYQCRRCKYHFTEESEFCPNCASEGVKQPLEKIFKQMT